MGKMCINHEETESQSNVDNTRKHIEYSIYILIAIYIVVALELFDFLNKLVKINAIRFIFR